MACMCSMLDAWHVRQRASTSLAEAFFEQEEFRGIGGVVHKACSRSVASLAPLLGRPALGVQRGLPVRTSSPNRYRYPGGKSRKLRHLHNWKRAAAGFASTLLLFSRRRRILSIGGFFLRLCQCESR